MLSIIEYIVIIIIIIRFNFQNVVFQFIKDYFCQFFLLIIPLNFPFYLIIYYLTNFTIIINFNRPNYSNKEFLFFAIKYYFEFLFHE